MTPEPRAATLPPRPVPQVNRGVQPMLKETAANRNAATAGGGE